MRYISSYQNSSHLAIDPVERKQGKYELTYIMLVAGVLDKWFMHSVN